MKRSCLSKKLMLCVIVLFSLPGFAQIPAGYYNAATGLTGDPLKNSLHTIIDGHIEFPYTSTATDVWDILKETDRDPNNPNNVIGIYSGFSMNAALEYDGGSGWNREHVWAKSRGDFGTTMGAGTDLHHLRAEDISTNSARNNRNFDNCTIPYIDGSGNYSGATESFTSTSEWLWQPRASVKGDIARMIFYMAVRYEGTNGEPDLEMTETYLSNTDKSPLHGKLSTLLQWHLDDPVDNAERTRNDIIYSFQQNRNPFIDHPEYACEIWPCSSSNSAPSFTSTPATTATEGQPYNYAITANDANGNSLSIVASSLPSWLSLVDNGNGTATLSGTPSSSEIGTHLVSIEVSDGIATPTIQSFNISVAAVAGGGAASDLFFSEYIEGTSYNKALEIANYTGTSVNLSGYSVFKQVNGAGAWGSELALSGTIASGEVYVIVNTSANPAMLAVADLTTGSGAMTFNGNDPLALFKNGILIDVIGEFNSTANYALDKTLVRSSSVSSPNANYTVTEWDVLTTDAVADLGMHTFDGESTPPPTCDVPATLSGSNITETSANISWSATTAQSYNIRFRASGSSTWTNTTSSATNMNLTNLASATTYEFQVSSQCSAIVSAYSASVNFTTLTPAPVCDVPVGMVVGNITETSADLIWNSTGAASYGVRYRLTGTTSWNNINSTSNTLLLSQLVSSASYEAQVRAQCGAISSSYSASAFFTTLTPVQTCNATSSLVVSGVTQTSANVSWTAANGAVSYNVRFRISGTSEWTASSVSATSLNLLGLLTATNYECQVSTQCGTTGSVYSNSVFFSTLTAPVSYCTSEGNNATEEWINRFVFNTIDNNSGMNGGYNFFSSLSTTVNTGSTYGFIIFPAWSGRSYNEAYNIWIDFNQDGDFNDVGEDVYSITKNKYSSISGDITIPSTALTGTTRMRVTLKYNGNATACESFSYGEVEDYNVSITGSSAARTSSVSVTNAPKIVVNPIAKSIYPNPANDVLNVMVEARKGARLQILTLSGKIMIDRHYEETGEVRIDVSGFDKGVYLLTIKNDGGKTTDKVIIN